MSRTDAPVTPEAPHSLEAEQAVLGGLMLSPEKFDDVSSVLVSDDFYRVDHKVVFDSMRDLSRLGVEFDTVTLAEHMNAQGFKQEGGLAYLATITRDTPTSANVIHYAEIVKKHSRSRRAIKVARQLALDVPLQNETAVSTAIQGLLALNEDQRPREHDMSDTIQASWNVIDAAERAEGGLVGISTGFVTLDERLGGLHRGDLIVCGARPAIGKTALMVNMAVYAGVPCGIMSAEQPYEQMGMRMLSLKAAVSVHRMRLGKLEEIDWKQLTKAGAELARASIWINDRPAQRLSDVIRQARKWKVRHGIKVLYVDYLQRIKADNDKLNTRERVAYVVEGLKNLALELDIPVFALAMVRREVELRDDRQPQLSDFKEAGEIEQEADLAITLHREGAYDPDKEDNTCTLLVCKNRHGPTGRIRLSWDGHLMRFTNYVEDPL